MTGQPGILNETRTAAGGVERWVLEPWERQWGLVAGITAACPNQDFALSGTPIGNAFPERPWGELAASTGCARVACSRQVHGASICRHPGEGTTGAVLDGFDGHLTSEPGILLAVTVADCVPVYLAEPVSGTMAMLHAGWRGIAAGVLEAGIAAVADAAGTSEAKIVMHCGVSICGACYEVGPEVFAAVTGNRPAAPSGIDLRGVLARRAGKLGVGTVTCSGLCTSHTDGAFFSHRASRGLAGRMVAYLGRPLA